MHEMHEIVAWNEDFETFSNHGSVQKNDLSNGLIQKKKKKYKQSYTDCLIHQSGVVKVNVTKIVQAGNKIILKMSILGVYQHNKKQIITS